MAANQPYISDRLVEEVSFWREYRNPKALVLTKAEVRGYYRLHKYLERSPPGSKPKFLGWPPQKPLFPPQIPSQKQPFLDKTIPELADWPNSTDGTKWKGVKYLGEGGYAQAGLWSYTGPIIDRKPTARVVVVKELFANKAKDTGMGEEAMHMSTFFKYNSQHVVRLLRNPVKTTGAIESLGPEWDGKVRRLVMEYCSLGDLYDLTDRQISSSQPFEELTLWKTFDCLVDGVACLEYGLEFGIDASTGDITIRRQTGFQSRVHFDLKPENIFLSDDRRGSHPTVPLQKVGDFGLTEITDPFSSPSTERDKWHHYLRRVGTRDYFAPEQFTERWEYSDWREGRVAGVYGSGTNIWGIRFIMFQLLTLTYNPPNHKAPFLPKFPLNNNFAQGLTYGVKLQTHGVAQGQKYSQSLIDLIYECLYEKPDHRPSLIALKTRVLKAIENCRLAGVTPEPWSVFLPAVPAPPPQPPSIQPLGGAVNMAGPPRKRNKTVL